MSKLIAAIDVYYLLAGGAKTHIPNAEVKFYHGVTNALLATVNAGAHGVVLPFTIGSIAQDVPVYYEYVESTVHYRGGQGNSGAFLYQDIVVAADPHESFYPAGNEQPAYVEVSIRAASNSTAAFQVVGTFAPTAIAAIPALSLTDKNLEIRVVSIAANGTRSHSEISHAPSAEIAVQLISDAPTVIQAGESTQFSVAIQIGDYPAVAQARRVRIADNAGMTTNLRTRFSQAPMANSADIPRDSGTANYTIYVRVSHSATPGEDGPWSAESTVLMLTYADSSGAGGTTGDGNPYGIDIYPSF